MSKRSNLWAFVVYPSSLPKDFLNIIDDWHIPTLLSPLHDKDVNPDGVQKIAHYHVMMDFGSGANKSFDQVNEYAKQLNGTIPIIINNRNAMIRYFVHFDNPEKKQYDRQNFKSFAGFDCDKAFEGEQNDDLMFEMLENTIIEKNIYNYALLVNTLKLDNLVNELKFLRRHSTHIRYLIDGMYQILMKSRNDS